MASALGLDDLEHTAKLAVLFDNCVASASAVCHRTEVCNPL